ncbi:MAG: phosphogluconate dehydrogenase (NAD(+)-dependent, decarboxylating) [Patescibacteria group bacterium]
MKKQIGLVGLGKMGKGISLHLHEQGWDVVGFDVSPDATKAVADAGVKTVASLAEMAKQLSAPRVVWVMLPAGSVSEEVFLGKQGLRELLSAGDVVIDAANAFYEDSMRRASSFEKENISFIDVGFSGGPQSARTGACIMVGGVSSVVSSLASLFDALTVKEGWAHCGSSGAGHFTKMVHNGIEYGMMQSLAEGFAVLRESPFNLDLVTIANLYNHRSIIESRLVGWAESGLEQFGIDLEEVSGTVAHTGEGKWTVETAKKLGVPVPSIELAYNFRVESEKNPSYIGKVLSMLRNQFGGHVAKK